MLSSARRTSWLWRGAAGGVLMAAVASSIDGTTSLAPMDSPLPALAVDPPCKRAPAGAVAPHAQTPCWLLLRASNWLTPTGLHLAKGERIRIQVPAGQFWFDAQRRSLPLNGDGGSDLMNLFRRWKRVPSAPWFSLIGATAAGQDPDPVVSGATNLGAKQGVLVATEAGELVFFANDASAPWGDGRAFYGNNHGQIWLQLQRCQADEASAPVAAPGAC